MSRKKQSTWETEQEYFPSTLRSLMKDRNITQKELADAIGVRPQTVSLYVTGQSAPDIHCLKKISEFFDVSADYLLGLSDIQTNKPDVTAAYLTTGLSEKSINTLNGADGDELDFISFLIENRISSNISVKAYGCAIDKSLIMALDKKYATVGLSKDDVRKMIQESDDAWKAFNEVKRLQERVDTRLWRCHKLLESAIESFIDHILEREENNGKR